MHGDLLFRKSIVLIIAIVSVAAAATAEAAPKHKRAKPTPIVCDDRGCSDRRGAGPVETRRSTGADVDANGNNTEVVGRRPNGCPREFCGCEASLYIFGEIRRELNLASNWIRKVPRTTPAPGMVAARNHHVMVLISHVDGKDWLVHDGNSGGGLTREHVMSINRYVIVDPHGSLSAER
jgi:hypothetical protein